MKKFHVVAYVQEYTPKLRKFNTLKAMEEWIDEFNETASKNPGDSWVDFKITNVTGAIEFLNGHDWK